MKKAIQKLIDKYIEEQKKIINPDDLDWSDLGFELPEITMAVEKFGTVENYIRDEEGFDEGQQAELMLFETVIEDLNALIKKN